MGRHPRLVPMGGVTGRLYQQFALTLAVSVALSAICALTLSPALCALILRPAHLPRGPLGAFFRGFNRLFAWGRPGRGWSAWRRVGR